LPSGDVKRLQDYANIYRKEKLYELIDIVDIKEYEILFRLLMKFVPVDIPYDDEIAAIKETEQDIINGELYTFDEIDEMKF